MLSAQAVAAFQRVPAPLPKTVLSPRGSSLPTRSSFCRRSRSSGCCSTSAARRPRSTREAGCGRRELRLQRDASEDRLRRDAGLLRAQRRAGAGRGRARLAQAGADAAGRGRVAARPRTRDASRGAPGAREDGAGGLRAAGGDRRRDRRTHGAAGGDGCAADHPASRRRAQRTSVARDARGHRRETRRSRARAASGPARARRGRPRARSRHSQGTVGVLSEDRVSGNVLQNIGRVRTRTSPAGRTSTKRATARR